MKFFGLVLLAAIQTGPVQEKVFEKVLFLGASVSDGFGNNLPLSSPFEKSIRVAHQPVEKLTSSAFFLEPLSHGKVQVDRALFLKPSLVVAVDYLFWYGYGDAKSSDLFGKADLGKPKPEENEEAVKERLELLEKGLAELDRYSGRIVIGDFPNMWGADPFMLSPDHIPSLGAIEKLNHRVHEWAKNKKNVLLIPLASWVDEMRSNKTKLNLPGKKELSLSAKQLLQRDRLHPNEAGVYLLCSRVIGELQKWLGEESKSQLQLDLAQALEDAGIDIEPEIKKTK